MEEIRKDLEAAKALLAQAKRGGNSAELLALEALTNGFEKLVALAEHHSAVPAPAPVAPPAQ